MQQTKKFKMADAISPYLAVSCGLIVNACHPSHWISCCYNAVQYNILYASQQWLKQNLKQGLNNQKTSHISPWRASYWESFVQIFFSHKIDHVIMAPYCTIFLLISEPGRMLQMKTTSWVLIPELALRSYSYWPHGYGISKEVNGCNWNLEDRIIVTAVKMTKNYTVDENLLVVFLCQYLLHTLWYCWHCLYLSIITYINIYIYILHTPFNVDYLMHWIIHLHTNYYDTKIVSSWDDCNIYINMWILWLKCRS